MLRYGQLYGPGTAFAIDGALAEQVRRRRFPVVGSGQAVFSFVHVEDAAGAVVRTLATGARSIFNVVDDDPVRVKDWLLEYARRLGLRLRGMCRRCWHGWWSASTASPI